MAQTDEYFDCVNNWWSGFVGKETCEAGYLVCKGEECDRYTPEKKQNKQTNADKYFRNATDEELAIFLQRFSDCAFCPAFSTICKSINFDNCKYAWLEWLKQEVSDD